jgi:GNAT superfamily N-acetyltransferase
MQVSLVEITADTVLAVTQLSVREDQKRFVASNAVSLAQALFSPEAWYRAIHSGNELAGFVMLHDESLRPDPPKEPQVGVWRFMVDAKFQGQGIGRAALQQVVQHVRAKKGSSPDWNSRMCRGLDLQNRSIAVSASVQTGRLTTGKSSLNSSLAKTLPDQSLNRTRCGVLPEACHLVPGLCPHAAMGPVGVSVRPREADVCR